MRFIVTFCSSWPKISCYDIWRFETITNICFPVKIAQGSCLILFFQGHPPKKPLPLEPGTPKNELKNFLAKPGTWSINDQKCNRCNPRRLGKKYIQFVRFPFRNNSTKNHFSWRLLHCTVTGDLNLNKFENDLIKGCYLKFPWLYYWKQLHFTTLECLFSIEKTPY